MDGCVCNKTLARREGKGDQSGFTSLFRDLSVDNVRIRQTYVKSHYRSKCEREDMYFIPAVTPKFSILPQNPTEAKEGHSIMIHCQAYGDPMPTIQWDKNNVMNGFDRQR
jgi:hypothetical protein